MSSLDYVESRFAAIARRNVKLTELSRWRIGGPADLVLEPRNCEEISAALQLLRKIGMQYAVIGDGSNILFDDRGYRGVILRVGPSFSEFTLLPERQVYAGGGLWVPDFVRRVCRAGLAGCVHAIGIPGRLGGLIVMNGGSQRKGIGDQILGVTVVRQSGEIAILDRTACAFSYRSSQMQHSGDIVIGARFAYEFGDPSDLRREALTILAERNRKFPRKHPNCGSVFLSDPAMYSVIGPPGKAIEDVGLKGESRGGAAFSPMHANFIVNTGNARSADVLALIALARSRVEEHTGYLMDCEVRYLHPSGSFCMAHEAI